MSKAGKQRKMRQKLKVALTRTLTKGIPEDFRERVTNGKKQLRESIMRMKVQIRREIIENLDRESCLKKRRKYI